MSPARPPALSQAGVVEGIGGYKVLQSGGLARHEGVDDLARNTRVRSRHCGPLMFRMV
jgi:hypothetical protein